MKNTTLVSSVPLYTQQDLQTTSFSYLARNTSEYYLRGACLGQLVEHVTQYQGCEIKPQDGGTIYLIIKKIIKITISYLCIFSSITMQDPINYYKVNTSQVQKQNFTNHPRSPFSVVPSQSQHFSPLALSNHYPHFYINHSFDIFLFMVCFPCRCSFVSPI